MHRHREQPKRTEERGFTAPVAHPGNPAAHGGITRTEHCSCGAVRRVNVNFGHIESGPWAV